MLTHMLSGLTAVNIPPCKHVKLYLSIPPLKDICGFQFFTKVNISEIKTLAYVHLYMCDDSPGYMARGGIAVPSGVLLSVLMGSVKWLC